MAVHLPLGSVPQPNDCMLERIEHWLLPPRCLLCGGPADRLELCQGCCADLPWIRRACRSCGLMLDERQDCAVCGSCRSRPPPFDHAVIPFAYEFPVDRLLLHLKFTGGLAAGHILGRLLADTVRTRGQQLPDVLVPVPLHPQRLQSRGYNQAEILAYPIERTLGIPVSTAACRRIRDTTAQSTLNRRKRRRNVAGSFECDDSIKGQAVALIDDICTTGSTLAAAADSLLDAGAGPVHAWCIARTRL